VIYLDACILIYAMEDSSARGDSVRTAMAAAQETLATSPLILPECLAMPLRTGDHVLRDRYLAMYHRLETVELGDEAPDALRLAAAQLAGASQLWTNDKRLAAASHGLAVDIIGG
jgi:predicted nucleic acid-binding protein